MALYYYTHKQYTFIDHIPCTTEQPGNEYTATQMIRPTRWNN